MITLRTCIIALLIFCFSLPAESNSGKDFFSFVVLGHIRGVESGKMNKLLPEVLSKVKDINPDLIFLTGDMIMGDIHKSKADPDVINKDWKQLDARLGQIGAPIYRVPGNHDINDPVTREIYFNRYGTLPQSLAYGRSYFILLNSLIIPKGNDPVPNKLFYREGKQLGTAQINFIKQQLEKGDQFDHIFLFTHHPLWWKDSAQWWKTVHPLLVDRKVRAVFSGDIGVMKFSYMKRDGVEYFQSSLGNSHPIEYLRTAGLSVLLAKRQFDTFLSVKVEGKQIQIKVQIVGETTSGKYTPKYFRSVYQYWIPRYERVWNAINTPKYLLASALFIGLCFFSGVVATLIWKRRGKPNSFYKRDGSDG